MTNHLNGDSGEVLVFALDRLGRSLNAFRQAVSEASALSANDLSALYLISASPLCTPGLLRQHMHITTGAATALIDRLENAGCVIRTPDESDRRRIRLTITSVGVAQMTRAREASERYLAASDVSHLERMRPCVEQVTSLLERSAGTTSGTAPEA